MAFAWLHRNVRYVCDGGSPVFDHVLVDRALIDFESKLEEFAVDARGAPWEYHSHNFRGFVQLACLIVLLRQF
jgi:hypothetical protein